LGGAGLSERGYSRNQAIGPTRKGAVKKVRHYTPERNRLVSEQQRGEPPKPMAKKGGKLLSSGLGKPLEKQKKRKICDAAWWTIDG